MRFFDATTKTLFITKGAIAQVELSKNQLLQFPDPDPFARMALRRTTAGNRPYFSIVSGELLFGGFDKRHESNDDLREVNNIICLP